MTRPIKLTLEKVKKAAAKAYKAKKLSAQGPTPACLYRDDSGLPCAIGAALTEKQRDRAVAAGGSVVFLVNQDVVDVPDDEMDAVRRIQWLHDVWCSAIGHGNAIIAECKFAEAIGVEVNT